EVLMSKDVKVALIGAVTTILAALIGVLANRRSEPSHADVHATAPQTTAAPPNASATTTPGTTTQTSTGSAPAPAPHPAQANELAGNYALEMFAVNGARMPFAGTMELTAAGSGVYSFSTSLRRSDVPGAPSFFYRGELRQEGAMWSVNTTWTTDAT